MTDSSVISSLGKCIGLFLANLVLFMCGAGDATQSLLSHGNTVPVSHIPPPASTLRRKQSLSSWHWIWQWILRCDTKNKGNKANWTWKTSAIWLGVVADDSNPSPCEAETGGWPLSSQPKSCHSKHQRNLPQDKKTTHSGRQHLHVRFLRKDLSTQQWGPPPKDLNASSKEEQ